MAYASMASACRHATAHSLTLTVKKTNMKNIYFTIALIIFTISLLVAQTEVSGLISEDATWSKLESPYYISSNIIIDEGVELLIESGVEIEVKNNTGIVVRGILKAMGTEEENIKIFPENDVVWEGIKIDKNYNPFVKLSYLHGKKAKTLIDIISMTSTSDTILVINNCWFDQNFIAINSIDYQTHFVEISNTKFTNNENYAFRFSGNSLIEKCEFRDNASGIYNNKETITQIDSCIFSGHTERAIAVNGVVTNSEFHNNNKAISTMNSNSPIMRYNHIHNNKRGIETWIWMAQNPEDQIKNNFICDNDYNVYQIYSGDAYLLDNCWCTEDETEIKDKIFDVFDDTNLGRVHYNITDTVCSELITSIEEPIIEEELMNTAKIYPNPVKENLQVSIQEPVIESYKIYSLTGRLISNQYLSINESLIQVNVQELESGIYFIHIQTTKGRLIRRFVKS